MRGKDGKRGSVAKDREGERQSAFCFNFAVGEVMLMEGRARGRSI